MNNSIKQSPSWEIKSVFASRKIPLILLEQIVS